MMNCEECSEKLSFLVFGESTPQEMNMLEHIAECETCREEYIELLEVESALSENLSDVPGADLTLGDSRKESVISEAAKMDGEKKRDFQSSTFKQFPVFITTLAACIAVSFIWYGKKAEKKSPAQSVVMEHKKSEYPAKSLKEAKTEVAEEELADADDILAKASGEIETLKGASNKKKLSSRMKRAELKEEGAPAAEAFKDIGSRNNALALDDIQEKALDKAPADKLIVSDAKMKKAKADVALNTPGAPVVAAAQRVKMDVESLVGSWLAANKSDEKVQKTAEYLKEWGYENITLTPIKIKDENALKVILQKKNEKPIDYGFFFIHNGEVIRFKPMTKVEIK